MKRIHSICLLGMLFTGLTGPYRVARAAEYCSADVPQTIPEEGTVSSTLRIREGDTIEVRFT